MTHLSLCSSQDDTMPNYPNCDCGDDYEQASKAAQEKCDGRTRCSVNSRHDAVSHGLTSVTLKCRSCGNIFRIDWD
jgi:hypothetical protein